MHAEQVLRSQVAWEEHRTLLFEYERLKSRSSGEIPEKKLLDLKKLSKFFRFRRLSGHHNMRIMSK